MPLAVILRKLGNLIPVPELEQRRRAIVRALRGSDSTRVADLTQRVAELTERVDALSNVVAGLRPSAAAEPGHESGDESGFDELPPNRVSVPPMTAAKISDHALDVLLGTAVRAGSLTR